MKQSHIKTPRRAMLCTIIAIAWPAMLEQALQAIVQYADTAMVGHIGVQATAAVGLCTTITWMTCSPLWSMGTGFLATIARAVGAKDTEKIRLCAMQGIIIALIMGIVLMGITLGIAPFFPKWLNADIDIRKEASVYFAILMSPMIFRALSVIMGACLRATGDTRTPMRVNLGMNAINVVLNFLLIFPTRRITIGSISFWCFGAGWGVIGAAIASAISITFSGSMMLCKVLRSEALSPRGMRLHMDRRVMGECVRIGLPVALQNFGVFGGHVMFSSQVASLGKTALAAHTIAITAEEAAYIPGYGMQAAASTLAGQALGEQNGKKLKSISRMVLLLTMGMMTITGLLLFIFPSVMMSIFTVDSQVIAQGSLVLRIVACSEPIYAAMIILEGIFHGVGQTRYPFVAALSTMWGARVLGTVLCVRVFGLGLTAVWLCMIADNCTRALLLALRYWSGAWRKSLDLET